VTDFAAIACVCGSSAICTASIPTMKLPVIRQVFPNCFIFGSSGSDAVTQICYFTRSKTTPCPERALDTPVGHFDIVPSPDVMHFDFAFESQLPKINVHVHGLGVAIEKRDGLGAIRQRPHPYFHGPSTLTRSPWMPALS